MRNQRTFYTGFKHPDNMTRKDKIKMIAYLKKKDMGEATKFWLSNCPRISRKAFVAA